MRDCCAGQRGDGGGAHNQPNKVCQCGTITAEARTSNNLANFPSSNL